MLLLSSCPCLTLFFSKLTAGVVSVDLDNPLHQGEVVSAIHYKEQMLVGNKIRNVVRIDLDDRDYRDVIADGYMLKLLDDRPNCLELTVPVCCYSRRNHTEAMRVKDEEVALGRSNARIQELVDVTRNGLSPDQKKVYLLRFPEKMVLSNDLYSPTARNGIVQYTINPMEGSTVWTSKTAGIAPHTYNLTNTHVTWMISTVQEKQLVVDNARDMTASEMMDLQMAGMRLR